MVWIELVTSQLKFGVDPPATATIIVSPMARETASTTEEIIPETAAGSTTFNDTSNLVEPNAKAPSRIALGTDDMASSEREAIIGVIIIPITIPGLSALKIPSDGINSRKIGVTN